MDCCKEVDCDIIGFDLKEKLDFIIRRGSIGNALKRNVQFEFNYRLLFNYLKLDRAFSFEIKDNLTILSFR
jgi:RNase P/RNase MRP subunit p30